MIYHFVTMHMGGRRDKQTILKALHIAGVWNGNI